MIGLVLNEYTYLLRLDTSDPGFGEFSNQLVNGFYLFWHQWTDGNLAARIAPSRHRRVLEAPLP